MKYETYDSLLLAASGSICYISDPDTHELLYMSKAAMDMCGLTSHDQYKGKKCHQILQGSDVLCSFCADLTLPKDEPRRWEHFNERFCRWFDISMTPLTLDGRACMVTDIRDITARRDFQADFSGHVSTEDALFRFLHVLATEKDLHQAIDLFLSYIGQYYAADCAYIFEANHETNAFHSTFKWYQDDLTQSKDKLECIPKPLVENWLKTFDVSSQIFHIAPDTLPGHGHTLLVMPLTRDNDLVGFIGVRNPTQNSYYPGLLRSVSEFILAELEKRRLLEELERLSYIDILTETSNRNSYMKTISEYLLNPPDSLGVISLSINGLKSINERYGQKYGDDLIIRTAERTREHTNGQVYRTGGDEFIVFCPNCDRDSFTEMASQLTAAFRSEVEYSVSIGYDWDCGETELNDQLHRAQVWMRARKQHFYQTEFNKGRSTGSSADDLLKDIADNRFEVWFQPQVDLRTGVIAGAEALVRKRGETGGLIPPNQFIPYYEARNVLPHLDMHVLDTTLAAIRKVRDQGQDISVSVNFSRSTLMIPNFAEQFHEMCRRHGVPPSCITVEVTETISALGHDTLHELLDYIRSTGLRLSLDDFGSKYSNLAILTDIEFDEIKFDKSLVDDICTNPRGQIMLRDLIRMCHALQQNTHIVAEGIEQPEQADLLKDYLCDSVQGFHFYRPMPFDDFFSLITRNSSQTQPEGGR